MLEFLGRFHPVFVHLPIGILLLACIFILLSFRAKFSPLKPAIPIILFLGMLSAIASCVTGYFLADGGDYEGELVNTHQWMGISVAVLSLVLYLVYSKVKSNVILGTTAVVLILMISITGHLGGSLTHGADYLTSSVNSNTSAIPPIQNIQEAVVYENAIQPLLKNRCYSCHGSEKKKGKLRLDAEEYILKGGKDGNTIVKGKAEDSELIRRLLLPLSNKDHMVPKEKPQLTENEITLLKWWIDNGVDFKKKFKDFPQSESFKLVLTGLQNGETKQEQLTPLEEVAMVDSEVLKKFTATGITIAPVTQNSNYLSANFINARSMDKGVLDLIKSIEKQLLWLKLENKKVNDQTLSAFSNCKKLTKLSINYSSITDAGLAHLKDLNQLQSLSLVGTKVTLKGIEQLKSLKNLKTLYVYQTQVSKADLATIKRLLPKVSLDTGNYKLPLLAQDTIEVK
ncbi:MAG: c-type cytochrome domain-containing protein [Bacteroidota bacterium]